MTLRVPVVGPSVPRRGNALSRGLGRLVLRGLGWRIEGEMPDLPRCVAIVAPHTSNWDFLVAFGALLALGLRGRFLGKDTLFRPPLGFLLGWAGGLPVDRARPEGVVEQAVAALRGEAFFLGLAPEGTRRRVDRFKTGFHRIAAGAGVPVWPVSIDHRARVLGFHAPLWPTADLEADLARLQSHFDAAMARYPAEYGVPPG